jgi:hypothetical protein
MIGLTALYFYLFVYEGAARVATAKGQALSEPRPSDFPAILQGQSEMYIGSILLFVWLLTIIVKSIRVARWQRMIALSAERAMQDQQGGN